MASDLDVSLPTLPGFEMSGIANTLNSLGSDAHSLSRNFANRAIYQALKLSLNSLQMNLVKLVSSLAITAWTSSMKRSSEAIKRNDIV